MRNKRLRTLSAVALIVSILPLITLIPVFLQLTLPESVNTVWARVNVACVAVGLILSVICVKSSESRSAVNIASYLIIENVDLEPTKQGIGYLVSLTVGILPLVWVGHWHEHLFIGIFSYFIIVAAISILIFIIGLIKLRLDVNEIKRTIGIRKDAHNEKI